VSARPGDDRVASAVFTHLAEPGNMLLGHLLARVSPGQALAAIRSGTIPGPVADSFSPSELAEFRSAHGRWRVKLPGIPPDGGTGWHAAYGITLLCPGDPGWPARRDDLGSTRPYALWVRGTADVQACSERSVAVIGARAATAYGTHVAGQLAGQLAEQGWTIISGAAHGVDASAHRAALAGHGPTIAVLACGPDMAYPPTHAGLLDAIAARGAVISEWPPSTAPARRPFLLRNQTVAASLGVNALRTGHSRVIPAHG
jgi:DNA processing protein